jgi:hypothetical protein
MHQVLPFRMQDTVQRGAPVDGSHGAIIRLLAPRPTGPVQRARRRVPDPGK